MNKSFRELVSEAVKNFNSTLTEFGEISYEEEMRAILNTKNTAALEKLSWDEDDTVRLMVAKNTNTPVEVLKRLADDLDDQVSIEASDTLEKVLYGITDTDEDNEEEE